MRTKNAFLILLLSTFFVLSSCKDDDDDVPAVQYRAEGYVNGTITGTQKDSSTPINERFTYNQFVTFSNEKNGVYTVSQSGMISMEITRVDLNTGGGVKLFISISSAEDTTPDAVGFSLQYFRESNDIFYFKMDNQVDPITITDFSFNKGNGRVRGKYSIEGSDNSTGKSAKVAGEFDVLVKQLIQ